MAHLEGAFLFPQMTMSEEALRQTGQSPWSPNFVDYLSLAFNTSTAFSPTDVPVLARWAKVLMMLQSLLSLLIIALLARSWRRAPSTFCSAQSGDLAEGRQRFQYWQKFTESINHGLWSSGAESFLVVVRMLCR